MSDHKTPETPGQAPNEGEVDIAAIAASAGLEKAAALFGADVMAAWRNAMRSRASLARSLPVHLEPHDPDGGNRS